MGSKWIRLAITFISKNAYDLDLKNLNAITDVLASTGVKS